MEDWNIIDKSTFCRHRMLRSNEIGCLYFAKTNHICIEGKCPTKQPPNKEIADSQANMWHCKKCGLLNIYWRKKCVACKTPATEF